MDKALTVKQKAFADCYIECGNATEAAKKAGYSPKYAHTNASKLLQNTTIKEYIDKKLEEISSKRIATSQEILEYLTSVMRGEEKDQFDFDVSIQDRTKAAELLGKRYGLFKDKVEVDNNVHSEKLSEIFEQIGGKGLEE